MKGYSVPDIIWPSSNKYGIPDLLPTGQAFEIAFPFEKWGDQARTKSAGTYHFYTDDYKFENVWRDPAQPLRAGVKALVECNFSSGDESPFAVWLWDLYRKRWLSRFWQGCGVKIWVDLNVPDRFLDTALLGVPKGWRAYCSRGKDSDYQHLFIEYELATRHSKGAPIFLVYGGGSLTENICLDQGWLFQPENMHIQDGRRRLALQLRILDAYYQREA